MSTPTCPDCGKPLPANAPGGLCPACLLHLAEPRQFTGPLDRVSTWRWDGSISLVPEPEHYGLALGGMLGAFALLRRWGPKGRLPITVREASSRAVVE